MTGSVTLFEYKADDIESSVTAYFSEEGDLKIDGYDIGERVKRHWGDSDYEYFITVKKDDLPKLISQLCVPESQLLSTLQARFNGNRAYSKFKAYLIAQSVTFDEFTWV